MMHIARNSIAMILAPDKVPAKPLLDSAADKAAEEAKTAEEAQAALDEANAEAIGPGSGDAPIGSGSGGAALDDATEGEKEKDEPEDDEPALDAASDYAASDIAIKSVAAVQEWVETVASDLEEGEGLGDRLLSLLIGIADDDMDGEISEDEAELVNMAAEAVAEYLISKGVSEDDAIALLNDFDNDLAATVQEFVMEKMGEGDDSDDFVFGDGSDESALDAVYKKKLVVRKGKKVRINKRVSGTIRLTAKQKMGIRKMLRKSHSAVAQLRRAKSNRVRKSSGL